MLASVSGYRLRGRGLDKVEYHVVIISKDIFMLFCEILFPLESFVFILLRLCS